MIRIRTRAQVSVHHARVYAESYVEAIEDEVEVVVECLLLHVRVVDRSVIAMPRAQSAAEGVPRATEIGRLAHRYHKRKLRGIMMILTNAPPKSFGPSEDPVKTRRMHAIRLRIIVATSRSHKR